MYLPSLTNPAIWQLVRVDLESITLFASFGYSKTSRSEVSRHYSRTLRFHFPEGMILMANPEGE